MTSDVATADVDIPDVSYQKRIFTFLKRPVVLVLVAGILIRLLIFPFMEVGYDSDFWALIIRNMEGGEGLYGLEGYYYTPIWGYVLGAVSVFQEAFLNIGDMGARFVEVFPAESFEGFFFSSNVTTVAFNFWVKIPFLISDILVGWLVYRLVKEKTGSEKKATIGFALWFLCPMIICVTSISGMFDTFAVLFTLLSIILVRKDHMLMGGVMLAMAVLTKFFPAYLAFIILAYILAKHKGDGTALKNAVYFVAGAIIAFLVFMLPQIMDGTFVESFLFIINRSGIESTTLLDTLKGVSALMVYGVLIPVSAYLAYRLYRTDKGKDDTLFKYSLLIIALLFLYPPTPQYLVLIIPFLAYYLMTADPDLKKSWILISVGATVFVLAGGAFHFFSFGAFLGTLQLEHIMEIAVQLQQPWLLGFSMTQYVYTIAGAIQYIGVLSVLYLLFIKSKYYKPIEFKRV